MLLSSFRVPLRCCPLSVSRYVLPNHATHAQLPRRYTRADGARTAVTLGTAPTGCLAEVGGEAAFPSLPPHACAPLASQTRHQRHLYFCCPCRLVRLAGSVW